GLYFDLKQFDSAKSYAQEAISLVPSEWLYHYLLGLIEKSENRRQLARESLELAIKLNASAAEAHDALGELDFAEGKVKEAVARFQRASELDPQQSAYRDHLASATRQLQKP